MIGSSASFRSRAPAHASTSWRLALALLATQAAGALACGDSSATTEEESASEDKSDAGQAAAKGDGAVRSNTNDAGSSRADAGRTDTGGARDGSTSGNAGGDAGGAAGDSGRGPSSPGGSSTRVDNPFAAAKGYVNPSWRDLAASEPGGERVANTPTAVWLDRIAAIEGASGALGLREHLDAALEQRADYALFVIYDLPGRDCAALASNGELGPEELPKYKADFIDPIAAIMGDAKYRALRIVNVIEVDSLPNLVTNASMEKCATMKANGGYVQGVAYALKTLGALPNVYNYVDAGHHGWLGWDSNLGPSAELFAQVANMAGMDNVHGFATNVANYSALVEPYFNAGTMVGGQSIRQSKWVDWNQYVDELSYAQAFREKLIASGFDAKIGMLIDTSRNGWGGASRPSAASSATDVETFVNASRVDRRIHAGNWCNQSGAGLGERPRAEPAPGVDAYVWVKPPGESDGSSSQIANSEGKGFDRMCDPTYGGNSLNGNHPTGALPDAPLSGAWFPAQFRELMQNAYPPL